jgi:hypothetical protein
MIGFDIKGSRGMGVRKNRSRDSVAQECGDNLFHWPCSVKAIPDEKLDGVGVYIQIPFCGVRKKNPSTAPRPVLTPTGDITAGFSFQLSDSSCCSFSHLLTTCIDCGNENRIHKSPSLKSRNHSAHQSSLGKKP